MIKAIKKLMLLSVIATPLIGCSVNADSVSEQESPSSDVEVQVPSKKQINVESDLETFVSVLPGATLVGCLAYILQSSGNNKCDDKKEKANKNSFEVK